MRALDRAPEPAELHTILTHVVDETSAICDTIAHELLGYEPVLAQTPEASQSSSGASQSQSSGASQSQSSSGASQSQSSSGASQSQSSGEP